MRKPFRFQFGPARNCLKRRGVIHRAPFWSISGVTRDTNGSPLAGVTVDLFLTSGDTFMATTVSDANGVYAFYTTLLGPYYCVANLSGSPNRAGVTEQTILQSLVSPG